MLVEDNTWKHFFWLQEYTAFLYSEASKYWALTLKIKKSILLRCLNISNVPDKNLSILDALLCSWRMGPDTNSLKLSLSILMHPLGKVIHYWRKYLMYKKRLMHPYRMDRCFLRVGIYTWITYAYSSGTLFFTDIYLCVVRVWPCISKKSCAFLKNFSSIKHGDMSILKNKILY